MKSRLKFALIVIMAVLGLAIVFYPRSNDLAKYMNLYERGFYDEVSAELKKELKRNPDWLEARELLVQVELKAGRVDSALANLFELKGAQWNVAKLQRQFDSWLGRNLPDSKSGAAWVEVVRQGVMDQPNWVWVQEFYLELLLKLQIPEEIPAALALLLPEGAVSFEKLSQVWDFLSETGNYFILWEASVILDRYYFQFSWRRQVLDLALNKPALEQLHRHWPGDPFLAAALAEKMEPREGLDFLYEWEQEYPVEAGSGYYSQVKSNLLGKSESIKPTDVKYIELEQVIEVALASIEKPEKFAVVLSFLEEEGMVEQANILRAVLAGPKPFLTIQSVRSQLSPDGEWLIWYDPELGDVVRNLKTGTDFPLRYNSGGVRVWRWSPDSRLLVLANFLSKASQVGNSLAHPTTIKIFNTRGEIQRELEFEERNLFVIGWRDLDTLWVYDWTKSRINGECYCLWNIKTGEIQTGSVPESPIYQVYPGPDGATAFDTGSSLLMVRGEKKSRLNMFLGGANFSFSSWLPDGSGLLLNKEGAFYHWTGGEPKALNIQGSFVGWRNSSEFYLQAKIVEGAFNLPGILKGCNYRTGETKDYNMVGNFCEGAGTIVISENPDKALVYRLP